MIASRHRNATLARQEERQRKEFKRENPVWPVWVSAVLHSCQTPLPLWIKSTFFHHCTNCDIFRQYGWRYNFLQGKYIGIKYNSSFSAEKALISGCFYLQSSFYCCIVKQRQNNPAAVFLRAWPLKDSRTSAGRPCRMPGFDNKKVLCADGTRPKIFHSPILHTATSPDFLGLGGWWWNFKSGWTGKRIGLFSFYSFYLFRLSGGGISGVRESSWSGGRDWKGNSLLPPFFGGKNSLRFIHIRMNGLDGLDFIWLSSSPFFLFC